MQSQSSHEDKWVTVYEDSTLKVEYLLIKPHRIRWWARKKSHFTVINTLQVDKNTKLLAQTCPDCSYHLLMRITR